MAEVRRRYGSGAYDFARKMCCRYILESLNKQRRSATQASSVSLGFLMGDIQNGELFGAESAADRVTVGVSQAGYARSMPLFDAINDVRGKGRVAGYYYDLGLKEDSLSNKTRVKNGEGKVPQHQSHAMIRRCFCTFGYDRQQVRGSRYLSRGQGEFVFIRAYSGNEARSEPIYKTKTGYYDILEVDAAATQAQIKTAYYKQSFIYHPDRNANSEDATIRFSEISEAYTVLGNRALRKKYDRGLLSLSDLIAAGRPSAKDAAGSSAKQQTQSRSSVVDAGSQGGVYGFDSFVKRHYNEQLERQRNLKVRKEELERKKEERFWEREVDKATDFLVIAMIAMTALVIKSL